MDQQDQPVVEDYLVDPDAACAFAHELLDGVEPALGRLRALRGAEAELNGAALDAARALDLDYVIQFRARPRLRYPDDQVPPADAYETEWEPEGRLGCVGYELVVSVVTRQRVEGYVQRLPEVQARREQRRRQRAALERREARRSRLRGARRRGAGRPGHRGGSRANAPPSGDDGEPEPEPPVARHCRRALCCQSGYCELCGIYLARDPDGAHDATHVLCWACWHWSRPMPTPLARRRWAA